MPRVRVFVDRASERLTFSQPLYIIAVDEARSGEQGNGQVAGWQDRTRGAGTALLSILLLVAELTPDRID